MIPRELLIHTVAYRVQAGTDRNRNPVYSEITLENVRVGISLATSRNCYGEVKADVMTLFIDSVNSKAFKDGEETAVMIPKEGDGISWNGKGYTVRKVTACYADSVDVHHWELELE